MPLPKLGYKFFFLAIVAMALPKMGKKKKGYEIYGRVKKKKLSCPQYFYNIFTINHKWLVVQKNLWQTNCGNGIAEIGKKKFVTN